MSDLLDHIVRLFDYDRWANSLVYDALAALDEDVPEKTRARLGHIAAAQQFWLSRFDDAYERPDGFFPIWDMEELRDRIEKIGAALQEYLEGLREEDMSRVIEYRATEGPGYSSQLAEVFTQLALHGSYHRGQIASDINPLLKERNIEPVPTDWIFFTRRTSE